MILAANVVWFVFGGGFFAWLGWLICGAILCCTVIGIPFGIAAFRIAGFSAFPFGKELVDARDLGEERITGTGLANLLWIILAGIWLAIGHIVAGIGCFLSFILIFPIFFGIAHFKLVNVCFSPLGKRVVNRD